MFFATPVMYSADNAAENFGFLRFVNPLWFVVEAIRAAALRGSWPSASLLGAHLVVASALLVAAVAYLRSIEHRIVDIS